MSNSKIYYLTLIPTRVMGGKKQISGLWKTLLGHQAQALVIFSMFPFMVLFFFWDKTPPRFVFKSPEKVEQTRQMGAPIKSQVTSFACNLFI